MPTRRVLLALPLLLLSSCLLGSGPRLHRLANATVSSDFESYALQRVGLTPFAGRDLAPERALDLQRALHAELSQSTPFELVLLDPGDLAELETSDPYHRGWYSPRTIIGLSKRYNLDGVLFGTVSQERFFPPQLLSMQVDMVSAETGLVIWSASVHLDATDQRVIEGLQVYYANELENDDWRVALLSPERFARFAAFQIACML
jgi:hypothetical protein